MCTDARLRRRERSAVLSFFAALSQVLSSARRAVRQCGAAELRKGVANESCAVPVVAQGRETSSNVCAARENARAVAAAASRAWPRCPRSRPSGVADIFAEPPGARARGADRRSASNVGVRERPTSPSSRRARDTTRARTLGQDRETALARPRSSSRLVAAPTARATRQSSTWTARSATLSARQRWDHNRSSAGTRGAQGQGDACRTSTSPRALPSSRQARRSRRERRLELRTSLGALTGERLAPRVDD